MHKPHQLSIGPTLFPTKETLSAAVIMMAMFFNAALAIINGHYVVLSRLDVSICEAAITGLAVLLIVFNFRANMLPWAILGAFLLLLHLPLALGNQSLNAKFIRDAIDIPIFIALGIVYARGSIVRLVLLIQCVVLLGLLLEVVFLNTYSQLFEIMSYYVNTRDFAPQDFWNTSSNLFVSATRPDERHLLGFFGLHRASSVFLEPVSLGNYSIVAAVFTLSFWRGLSPSTKVFLIISTLIILICSDGRLAALTIAVLVLGSFVLPILPRYSNVLYLPAALLFAGFVVTLLESEKLGDDITGRLAVSMDILTSLDVPTLLGMRGELSNSSVDSGISYFIITQSVIGLIVGWLFICLVPTYSDRRSMLYVHSICIYISLNLLVSYSLFSIKTAALMWFVYGYLLPEYSWRRQTLLRPPGQTANRVT